MTSKEDAWGLLACSLTRYDLDAFEDVFRGVLGELDPSYDMPVDQRWAAGMYGKSLQRSGLLREGLAETTRRRRHAGAIGHQTYSPGSPTARSGQRSARAAIWFWEQYLADESQAANPLAAPLLAPDLRGLPPALVITAEYDVLRDEGERYVEQLRAAGVPALVSRYDGVHHRFAELIGILDQAGQVRDEMCAWLREVLAGTGFLAEQPGEAQI